MPRYFQVYVARLHGARSAITGSNGPVTFDTAGNVITLTGALSGAGGLTVAGGGVLELGGANTYSGDTIVNSGTLQLDAVGSSAGALRMAGGTFLNLNFSGTYLVGGFYTNGVALINGTYNSANLPGFITGTGSIQVVGAIPHTPTKMDFSVSGGNIALSWPANYQGWILQQQTNGVNVELSTNWVDVAGTANMTSTNIPISSSTPTVFYRLRYPAP